MVGHCTVHLAGSSQYQSSSFISTLGPLAMASSHYPSDGDEFAPSVDCTLSLRPLAMASSQYPSEPYSSPPLVDCTLSLGTPSSRRSSPPSFPCNTNNAYEHHRHSGGSSSSISNNFFSNLHSSQYSNSSTYYGTSGHHTISNKNAANASSGGNPPVVRCCAICDTTATPLWRKGPKGPKTLCNACGIRFKKVERRAKAAAAATNHPLGGGGIEMGKPTNPERGSSTPSWRRRKSPAGSGTTGSLSSPPSLPD